MTTKLLRPILFISFILVGFGLANASNIPADSTQTTAISPENERYLITKNNSQKYIGYIISDDGRDILLETENIGRIYIPKTEISEIEKVTNKNSRLVNESMMAGAFSSRYILNSNALPVVKGQNFAAMNLYGPEVHFALTDNFSLGLVSTWIASPFLINAVYRFTPTKPKLYFSVGTTMGTSGYINNMKTWGGYHYGNVTYGDRKSNLTVGAGFHYVFPGTNDINYDFDSFSVRKEKPELGGAITVSGITKSNSKTSFIFDSAFALYHLSYTDQVRNQFDPNIFNYYETNETNGIFTLMFGMRFQRRENSAFQFSLNTVTLVGDDFDGDLNTFPMPTCTWFINF